MRFVCLCDVFFVIEHLVSVVLDFLIVSTSSRFYEVFANVRLCSLYDV